MKGAILSLIFDDGTTKEIELIKCIVSDHQGKEEIAFRQSHNGWIMYVTEKTLRGKKLASDLFLTVNKDQ